MIFRNGPAFHFAFIGNSTTLPSMTKSLVFARVALFTFFALTCIGFAVSAHAQTSSSTDCSAMMDFGSGFSIPALSADCIGFGDLSDLIPSSAADAIDDAFDTPSLSASSSLDAGASLFSDSASTTSLFPFELDISIGDTSVTGSIDPTGGGGLNVNVDTAFGSFALTSDDCVLTIIKRVVGGTAVPSDFQIHVNSGGADVSNSPQAGSSSGTIYNLNSGTYTVTESGGPAGYTASFSGACDASGTMNISASDSATCIITNTFATSTPGGGSENPGGGGGDNPGPGGGGNNPGGGGTSGGGGGGGSSGGGGSNGGGPITQVSPETATIPESGVLPGVPNTGSGGTAPTTLLMLAFSGMLALGAGSMLRKTLHD